MSRNSWFGGAAAAFIFVCPLTALAQEQPAPGATAPADAASFTEDQLRAFAAASAEIDPISRAVPTMSAEQRAEAATRIQAILQQNNLDSDTYNAIASRAQTDATLAARIDALRAPAAAPETPPQQ